MSLPYTILQGILAKALSELVQSLPHGKVMHLMLLSHQGWGRKFCTGDDARQWEGGRVSLPPHTMCNEPLKNSNIHNELALCHTTGKLEINLLFMG